MEKVGEITREVQEALNLPYAAGTPIYIGESNYSHMRYGRHAHDYIKYGAKLRRIISEPDYVGVNDIDDSVEYVKFFGDFIKIAVRVAGDGELYARSLYHVKRSTAEELIKIGRWKPLTKSCD